MDEKNLMMEEVVEDAAEEIAKVKTGMSTPMAMLIGSGLTLAAIVGYKQLKKVIAKRKIMQYEEPDVVDGTATDVEAESEEDENDSEK
jgi:hypothetical protein